LSHHKEKDKEPEMTTFTATKKPLSLKQQAAIADRKAKNAAARQARIEEDEKYGFDYGYCKVHGRLTESPDCACSEMSDEEFDRADMYEAGW
jgi:hypothetical protein